MRISRYKKANKHLKFYSNNFGFRKPYQVLIDGTFCFTALQNKINIHEQLKNYLDMDVKLLTTKCVIIETELLGKHLYGAMIVAKQFAIHRCGHDTKPIPGSSCFKSMIGDSNANRYIIATQDRELQDVARSIPGTPVVYFHQRTPTLEEPSKSSLKAAQDQTDARFGLTKMDVDTISQLKENVGLNSEEVKRKKKKKGGPNPLSCKKSKKKSQISVAQSRGKVNKKRKRRRIKIPEHVITELLKTQ